MAFEADCGGSTVLEELHMASTTRFPVPGECRGPHDEALRNSAALTRSSEKRSRAGVELIPNAFLATRPYATTARRLWAPGKRCKLVGAGDSKLKIKNS